MKTKMLYEIAAPIAARVCEELSPFCHRIQTAGSLRRNRPEVGDIEIVAIPKPWQDMFGEEFPLTTDHALNHVDYEQFGVLTANGNKLKKIQLHEGIQVDLFIVTPPAQWGVIFLLRTGPEDYSHNLVTKKEFGGKLPSFLRVEGGAIWKNYDVMDTPQEEDVYRILDLPYVEPKDRL